MPTLSMNVYVPWRQSAMRMPHSRLRHITLRFSTLIGRSPPNSITPRVPFVQTISETSHVRVAFTTEMRE